MKRKKMSRLLIAASLCLALIFTYSAGALAVQVLAADPDVPTVTIVGSGSTAKFTFNRPKQTDESAQTRAAVPHDTTVDLFDSFKNVMPGDHLIQPIRVEAAAGNDSSYKVYLYARVCGDNAEANLAFLNAMTLKVSQGTDELDVLNAGEDAQGIYLGTFERGNGKDLTVDLTVPIEMGNEFQDAECYVDWYFYAEQVVNGGGDDKPDHTPKPSATPDPSVTPSPTPTTPPPAESSDVEIDDGDVPEGGLPDIDDGDVPHGGLPDIEIGEDGVPLGDMPQTGDDTNLPLLLGAMVVSGSTLAGILIFGRKREDEGTN
ncbi:MAG: LPXTG cell wall anchor domain-containing protein [Lachnospirales bacterium]